MNSRSTPREQLLQAGSRLLGQIDMTDLARALSISAVVDEAGLSHQTFHNTYPGSSRAGGTGGKEAFVEDLLDNLTVNYSGLEAVDHNCAKPGELTGPASALFDDLVSGLMRRRLIAILLSGDNDGARKAVAPEFERFDADFRTVVGGLALREMLTPGSIAARDVATATESILRWAIDPLHSDRNTPAPEPIESGDDLNLLRPDLEADIIAATETLFVDHGYFLVTLADIAAAARIRVDDLRRLFPSKIDIIVAALKPERFINGIVTTPVISTLATALPDTVPNSPDEMTEALPAPPQARPVRQ